MTAPAVIYAEKYPHIAVYHVWSETERQRIIHRRKTT